MPNLDGTGPRGMGRMSGRGRGYCAEGMGCGCTYAAVYGGMGGAADEKEQAEMLKERLKMIEEERKNIEKMLKELKK